MKTDIRVVVKVCEMAQNKGGYAFIVIIKLNKDFLMTNFLFQ